MGRCLQINLPLVLEQVKPNWPYLKTFSTQYCEFEHRQKNDSDCVHPLPSITEGLDVLIMMKDGIQVPGVVSEHTDTPHRKVDRCTATDYI